MNASKNLTCSTILQKAADSWHRIWQLLALWVVWRLLSSLFAASISSLLPLTKLEQDIPLLPPSAPLATWLERALAAPWLRWDAAWYVRITAQGYNATDGSTNFHPLFPWLATLPATLGVNPCSACSS
jgi:hypothetical protein